MLITQATMIVVGLGHYGIESAYLIETGQFTESQFVESIAFTQYKELAPQVYILTEPSFKKIVLIVHETKVPSIVKVSMVRHIMECMPTVSLRPP